MRAVFADTFYWVALTNQKDSSHQQAISWSHSLQGRTIVTTDEVLTEFLIYVAGLGPLSRRRAAQLVRNVLKDPNVRVIPQTRQSFLAGFDLYEARLDKGYSLTDCVSMNVMKAEGLIDILTHDEHFNQEGFRTLFT